MLFTKRIKQGCEMDNLIVMGDVPGTDLQITFGVWLGIAGGLIATYLTYKLLSGRRQFAAAFARQPLHASQLHQRG